MPAPVPRQECHSFSGKRADDNRIARFAKRRGDGVFFYVAQALHVVKT